MMQTNAFLVNAKAAARIVGLAIHFVAINACCAFGVWHYAHEDAHGFCYILIFFILGYFAELLYHWAALKEILERRRQALPPPPLAKEELERLIRRQYAEARLFQRPLPHLTYEELDRLHRAIRASGACHIAPRIPPVSQPDRQNGSKMAQNQ